MTKRLIFLAVVGFAVTASGADGKKAWTDPGVAKAEDPSFSVQGEYVRAATGLQVVALGDGQFYMSEFAGGLPGAGWDGSDPVTSTGDEAAMRAAEEGMKKVARTSPTLGKAAPEGAVVLVDGVANDLVKGEVKDGVLWAGAQTTGEYGSFSMHVEFRLPYKPGAALSSQDRGNSGLYLHNRYEVQILDSFGLVYDREKIGIPAKSDPKQWCACLYRFKAADVPMCLPPLVWQTYDIEFTAATFEGEKKVANARITVVHNGVKVHDDVELPKGTGVGGSRPEVAKGPIVFQGHGNPVAFRNVWLVEKEF